MKILVTGITGFIGKRLLPLLESTGEEIAVLCRRIPAGLPGSIRVIEGDLNKLEDIASQLTSFSPDVCIHLAWEGIPDYGFDMSRRNLDQGTALFRLLAEECGCKKIIALGSCWEYGRSFGVCREADPVSTNSFFVWAKHALCDLGMMLSVKHEVSFVWLRAFYVYGPGQRPAALIPTLTAAVRKGVCPEVKTPLNASDFVHVDDVAAAVLAALRQEVPSGIYNVGSGEATSVWKVCEYIELAMGLEPRWSVQLRNLPVESSADFQGATEKSFEVFGWKASTSLERGISRYVRPELV